MLDKNALSQLCQLKRSIADTKRYETGTVRGTAGRYGFVLLDCGGDAYLAADEMQRVFPDDRVRVEIVEGDNGKLTATLDKLLESPLLQFTGRYVERDNAHFVEPDLPRLSRWLFVPPRARGQAHHGDWVHAQITRHPFKDGRPQTELLAVIGNDASPTLPLDYAMTRFGLPAPYQTEQPLALAAPALDGRQDLTGLPFVTIDGVDTLDMDDALQAEGGVGGWTLRIAIADPDVWIEPGSSLEQDAANRGQSVYLPGRTLGMLPDVLAHDRCSLKAGETRPALVAELVVATDGSVSTYRFCEAIIRSRTKLSYDDTAAWLDTGTAPALPAELSPALLTPLAEVAAALLAHRRQHHLVSADRPDYRLHLGSDGQLDHIERVEKNSAQQLVEDCMIAANRAAADYLGDGPAVFVTHAGVRAERRPAIAELMTAAAPDAGLDADMLATLPGYTALVRTATSTPADLPLQAIVMRSLERSQLSERPQPHFGMGVRAYTTMTSPLRKWNDLLIHRAIKARLRGESPPNLADGALTHLQQRIDQGRQASQLAEQWLKCRYIAQRRGQRFAARVVHVNSGGFTARIEENGIEGFVDLRRCGKKFSFDPITLRLIGDGLNVQLEQPIDISVDAVDTGRRTVTFGWCELAEALGARAPTEKATGAQTEKATDAPPEKGARTSPEPSVRV